MNLDESEKTEEKKLTRKEKKALKRAEREAAKAQKKAAKLKTSVEEIIEDHDVEVMSSKDLPPPNYTAWEKISPPAKRRKQLATMESGYREVLALVHSMRENQEVLMESFKKLPEAVDSVKQLADHSAQQSKILTAMNEQLESGSAGKFNETLTSMDKTTQLLLERAQRSEERLYSMLRRAQRRIAFMTLLVLLLFLGAATAILLIIFPEQTQTWLEARGWAGTASEPAPAQAEPSPVLEPVAPLAENIITEPVDTTPLPEPVEIPELEDLETLVEETESSLPETPAGELTEEPPLKEDMLSIAPIPESPEEEIPEDVDPTVEGSASDLVVEPEEPDTETPDPTKELEPLSTLQEDE